MHYASTIPLCLISVAEQTSSHDSTSLVVHASPSSAQYAGVNRQYRHLQDGEDLFDGSHIVGPSRGRIEGSGIGGAGIGTILQVRSSHKSEILTCMVHPSVVMYK